MHKNEELIHRFYSALQKLDSDTMISCYHKEARFKDPVFELESKDEIAAMWSMLCSRAKEFELTFGQVKAGAESGSANLEASYLFSQTNRKVLNKIEARFRFKEGLIVDHVDSFNFWKWSRQALGLTGYLLGWTPFLQNKVKQRARKNMRRFFQRN